MVYLHDFAPWNKDMINYPFLRVHLTTKYKFSNVIFMVRDPRDVVVSSYFYKKYHTGEYEGSIQDYVYEPRGNIELIVKYMNIWEEVKPERFLVIRYEDLHTKPLEVLTDIAEFMDFKTSKEIIEQAIEDTSFDNMQAREKTGNMASAWFSDGTNPDAMKCRKGKVGEYKDHFKDKELEYLNDKMKSLSPYWGYN
jgi:hypothetical protein